MPIQPTKATIPPEALASAFKFRCYPVPNFNASLISQPFGENWADFYRRWGLLGHNGEDIALLIGTRLYALFDCEIVKVAFGVTGGNTIEYVSSGINVSGYPGVYRLHVVHYHLNGFAVGLGQKVKAGELVAFSGNTGTATTGPHLHLGLFIEKKVGDGWMALDMDNGFDGRIDPKYFYPDRHYELLPVDFRYGLGVALSDEAYKKVVTPWLRTKLKREPTERELNAFSYGHWAFEEVMDEVMLPTWTKMTKAMFKTRPLQTI